ncbi:hypothetical protein ABZ897_44395 [Nonomuraea sp. NPDC046802]|uniref:hypothetical protein n=1 Tax=Nonomuraea sp. NPDC046802 TaxID=3154919 RepID=UPI00340846F0
MSNFEERLLAALEDEITTRTAGNEMTMTTPARRRYAGLSAAVAGVAAATTAVVMLTSGSPAFAVTTSADGTINVRISEFRDPEGLEAELGRAGVKAVVDYLPEGQTCKGPRGERGSATGQFQSSVGKDGGGIWFTIEKGQVPAGETLVLAVSKSSGGDDQAPFATSLEIVKGTVSDCEAIPMPAPDMRDGGGMQSGTGEDGPILHSRTEGSAPGPHTDTNGQDPAPTVTSQSG